MRKMTKSCFYMQFVLSNIINFSIIGSLSFIHNIYIYICIPRIVTVLGDPDTALLDYGCNTDTFADQNQFPSKPSGVACSKN